MFVEIFLWYTQEGAISLMLVSGSKALSYCSSVPCVFGWQFKIWFSGLESGEEWEETGSQKFKEGGGLGVKFKSFNFPILNEYFTICVSQMKLCNHFCVHKFELIQIVYSLCLFVCKQSIQILKSTPWNLNQDDD